MAKFLLPLLLVIALASNVYSTNQDNWLWCLEDEDDMDLCDKMTRILQDNDPNKNHSHTCMVGGNPQKCMSIISQGNAMFGIYDGGEILEAATKYNMKALRKESNSQETFGYWGVGIVKNCPNSLSDIKGWKSCHTGYGRSAGWVLPITYLLDNKIMPLVSKDPNVLNDIESVKSFFSKSCAASNEPEKSLCTACSKTEKCNEEDPYYDYEGAFRCLVEGSGDIAFTKHDIPTNYAKGAPLAENWTNLQNADNYKILCPGRKELCAEITKFEECNFGMAPGHTIMARGDFAYVKEFQDLMDKVKNNLSWVELFKGDDMISNEFAAGASNSFVFTGTIEELMGSLYNRTQELNKYNAIKTTDSSAGGLLPSFFFMLATTAAAMLFRLN